MQWYEEAMGTDDLHMTATVVLIQFPLSPFIDLSAQMGKQQHNHLDNASLPFLFGKAGCPAQKFLLDISW